MNYWKEMYGTRSKEFIEGVIAGVEAFAFWKDNKQCVGPRKEPLKEEIESIKEGLGWKE